MDAKNGMMLWVMGGTGVFLLWSGITNRMDLGENLKSYLDGKSAPNPAGKSDTYSDGSPKPDGPGEFTGGIGGYFGSDKDTEIMSTHVNRDQTGIAYVYDQHGNMISRVPDAYQDTPNLYRPGNVQAWGSGMQ